MKGIVRNKAAGTWTVSHGWFVAFVFCTAVMVMLYADSWIGVFHK